MAFDKKTVAKQTRKQLTKEGNAIDRNVSLTKAQSTNKAISHVKAVNIIAIQNASISEKINPLFNKNSPVIVRPATAPDSIPMFAHIPSGFRNFERKVNSLMILFIPMD